MKFPFFHQPKPRQFEYRPRYYDPVAEAREKRKQEILGPNYKDSYTSDGENKEYKRGQYIEEMKIRRGILADRRREKKRTRMFTSFVMLAALILIAYWIVKSTLLAI